ncbi:hypothetical protein BM523_08790 [Alteromonas mediterranea]|jgi:hypothetical protein|uniref:DUF3806 domain-containing protein n=1 Tax=Alteromonas mediterranea TaxID=314275 RepID=A0AAC8XJF1_9ALTE|nr:hypothetical protein [Alteromonas mediterranea]MBR9895771.1 hypothetical protein [Gammaproteobacteria bacterium]MEA3379292.1 hypothetical protein [Pseudomonadota bacterium]AFV85556.1 hypothetical protein amad1_10245 [Alteromonas mediterranea DE1]AGP97568.1 hypothetical protein I635_10240 [Alteromonas mediterranea UM7]AGQ01821.1 hypothetical protein I636_09845 [Alteromonas mediterranea UM4b]|tara:strand:- start:2218 stop:2631 length:414 start_codon:yes stop_codon:yes gene_type:complete
MSPDELNKLMSDCAKDAAVTAADEFNIVLDNSPESVALVDDVLLSFVDKYHDLALEDEAVFTICNIFGAYIGEILKAQLDGEWIYDQSNPKAPSVFLKVGDNTYALAGICYERLVNDSQISVFAYYEQALANHKAHH